MTRPTTVTIAAIIAWILRHFEVWTSEAPAGPVIITLTVREYLNIRVKLLFTITFSVRLTR